MLEYKSPITIRGAHLTCPLPLALESYWACEADCLHCVGRRLNKTWGEEQRAADPEAVERLLQNGLRNPSPRSPIAQALHAKKALWIGRKADPYQPVETELKVTRRLVKILTRMEWPFVVCSRYQSNAVRDEGLFSSARELMTFLVEITPGGESDWELFERKRTTPVERRLRIARHWQKMGIHVGVRGEPFIPGHHTTQQFRDMLRRLKDFGLKSYNTYNLHMNEYTMRRLKEAGLDVVKIGEHCQDKLWRPIQQELCRIAEEERVVLGCPDFVNVPKEWKSCTNTCCGVDVQGAFTFNTHHWRRDLQQGKRTEKILEDTWEGIGTSEDKERAQVIMLLKSSSQAKGGFSEDPSMAGTSKDHYTMKDAGL